MNKKQLIKTAAARSEQNANDNGTKKLTRAQLEEAWELFESITVETIGNGEAVKIVGFASYEPAPRAARQGFNPQTEQKMEIPAKVSVKISAGSKLKDVAEALDPKDFQKGGKFYKTGKASNDEE